MKNLTIYQVDAFADEIFQGNPAAVVVLEKPMEEAMMQLIAAENNLAETAFLVPDPLGFHIRWFTPVTEVALCGHATLASAHVVYQHLGWKQEYLHFHTKTKGTLVVKKEEQGIYTLDFPAQEHVEKTPPAGLVEAMGVLPIKVYQGETDWMLCYEDQAQIEQLAPDFNALKKIPARGIIATAPGKEVDFVSRFFGPAVGIDEDPVTGSAHTLLVPYWAIQCHRHDLSARQLSARGGSLHCTLVGERVWMRGQAHTYMVGTVFIP